MKNRIFTVNLFEKKTVQVILNEKVNCYFLEWGDIKRLFEIELSDLPQKHRGNLVYTTINDGEKSKKYAGVDVHDLEIIKNFSTSINAEKYMTLIKSVILNINKSYSGYIKEMVLPKEEQNNLIDSVECKAKTINMLEGKIEVLKERAKLFREFTGNTQMIPLSIVNKKLKYKTTYPQLLAHLRQCEAIDEFCNPTPKLIENGCFRIFGWETIVGDKKKKTTQVMVTEKGLKFINEILEKSNGRRNKNEDIQYF